MGTYWAIDLSEPATSFSREYFSQKIIGLVDLYDKTFSDWREDSELRSLEKNLTNFQKPSKLFLKGLKYSLLSYKESKGNFDVTVGAVIWKERREKIGLDKLILKDDGFKFKEDPKRLTFGGIVKGMAVGSLANWLFIKNIKNFRINAGDGNLVFSGKNFKVGWEEEIQTGTTKPNEVTFLSRSNLMQNGRRHIIGKTNKVSPVLAICTSSFKDNQDWEKIGALSDAYSTSLILDEGLDWSKYGCRK